ncbi:AsnC family transcriptional regulator [Neorhizobium alkalisoli]|uniref:AsnC family transcriptional regulator n=2 Tax=Neorhizobium alkalisoli TaxID=528178 RepID=A0A561QGC2_9HYPH|nr:AsnC family transcriptional regulator [Neorhizobium alkalisoli]
MSSMNDMDAIDLKLISLLRHNGRRSVTDLAVELDISRATIRSRMDRLERQGHILGYTVILRADAVELPVRGIMMIEIEGRAAERVVDKLADFPEISEIHTTNGRWDLIVELGAGTLTELDGVLRRIRQVPGISGSETNLLLATPRSTKARL